METWLHTFAFPGKVAATARRVEELGLHGLMVADSQNLTAEVWVELALAAQATERIKIGPGVTNPATRHPAVTASAVATIQAESGGRAVLGLGRGDSALAQIGMKPVPVEELESALAEIQGYLDGGIAWIAADGQPKVPVTVAATGPHVIAVGAKHAEALDFTVGAEPDRLRWAVDCAREAAGERKLSLGAFLNVAVHDDAAVARDLVRGSTAIFARFATEGAPPDGLSEVTRDGIAQVASDFDESQHGNAAAAHARALDDAFLDRFAIAGPAAEVKERLDEIAALGIERIVVVPGSLDSDPELVDASVAALAGIVG